MRPNGRRGGGSVVSRPLVGRGMRVVGAGDRGRVPVHGGRAFGPDWRRYGGLPLVLSDRRCGGGGAELWTLAGFGPIDPQGLRHALLRDVGAFPGRRGSVGGGMCPLDVVAGGVPLRHCVGIGW